MGTCQSLQRIDVAELNGPMDDIHSLSLEWDIKSRFRLDDFLTSEQLRKVPKLITELNKSDKLLVEKKNYQNSNINQYKTTGTKTCSQGIYKSSVAKGNCTRLMHKSKNSSRKQSPLNVCVVTDNDLGHQSKSVKCFKTHTCNGLRPSGYKYAHSVRVRRTRFVSSLECLDDSSSINVRGVFIPDIVQSYGSDNNNTRRTVITTHFV